MVLTFVFKSNVSIFASALTKVFLLLEIPTSSSKSSCADSTVWPNVSRILSVASLSLFSELTNVATTAVISATTAVFLPVNFRQVYENYFELFQGFLVFFPRSFSNCFCYCFLQPEFYFF